MKDVKTGTVKFFNYEKGYGFVKYGEEDIFVHKTGLTTQNIKENDKVTFSLAKGKKGINAVNVTKIVN